MNVRGTLLTLLLFLFLSVVSSAQVVDVRVRALSAFLHRLPVKQYSIDFIKAADEFHLDWRLLPCLSILESGGGKAAPNHNLFGWGSGRARFESAKEAIYAVAARLANAPHYVNKSLAAKLKMYNPADSLYASKVAKLMEKLERLRQSTEFAQASASSAPPDDGA